MTCGLWPVTQACRNSRHVSCHKDMSHLMTCHKDVPLLNTCHRDVSHLITCHRDVSKPDDMSPRCIAPHDMSPRCVAPHDMSQRCVAPHDMSQRCFALHDRWLVTVGPPVPANMARATEGSRASSMQSQGPVHSGTAPWYVMAYSAARTIPA